MTLQGGLITLGSVQLSVNPHVGSASALGLTSPLGPDKP